MSLKNNIHPCLKHKSSDFFLAFYCMLSKPRSVHYSSSWIYSIHNKMSDTKCEVNFYQCLRLYIMLPMQGKDQQKESFLD